ncbi:hypothetical protein C8J57DRAFT_1539999 [Mycena rebaudengoi]|nr:hypothetical protein C8J57DRAFT_1539999 [Mycena rebaudengoi]
MISTFELLELILAHLPMPALLVIMPLRVLFFQPDPLSLPIQNPLLVELFPPFFRPADKQLHAASSITSMPWAMAPATFKRAEASWRHMLTSQPAVQTMMVTQTVRSQMVGRRTAPRVHCMAGGETPFSIQWHNNLNDADEGNLTLALFTWVTFTVTELSVSR